MSTPECGQDNGMLGAKCWSYIGLRIDGKRSGDGITLALITDVGSRLLGKRPQDRTESR